MKKFQKYIFLFIIFITLPTIAQKKLDKSEIYLGINAGRSGSMVFFNPSVNQTFLLGLNGGAVFRYIADKNVGVQAELNFSQRGWNENNSLYSRQLNYIELPFMTHFYLGNNFRFFINLGPKISFLLSEKVILNNTVNSIEPQHITTIDNSFDYGFCAGIGFMLKIKRQVFQLDARANYSMSDIYSNDKRDYFDTSNNVNASINIAWLLKSN